MSDYSRYETPAAMHRLLGLSCTGYGYKTWTGLTCGPRTLGCYAAVLITKGSGWIETSATSGRLRFGSNTLFWLFPTVTHTYAPDDAGWAEQWVLFEGAVAETFESLGFLSPARPVVSLGDVPEIASLFAQIHADFTSVGPLAGVLSAALIHRLVVLTYNHTTILNGADEPTTRTVRYLEEHAFQPLDLSAVARRCGMGYSTFRRRFKQVTGYGPKEYVLRVRLSRAKEMLALTHRSITDVATAVGFDDPYYFSRLFRAKEGLSPSEFRDQQARIQVEVVDPVPAR